MHKTQGFGSTGRRGEYIEYFEYLKGDSAKIIYLKGLIFLGKELGKVIFK